MTNVANITNAPGVQLDSRSMSLRKLILATFIKAGRGHVGPALSIVEILRVLYDDILKFQPDDPGWSSRDRFILSKGHGCLSLYAILAEKGFFPLEQLETFCAYDSPLGGHPEYQKVPGVEATTGALGHGLSIGVGLALAARMKRQTQRVFVLLGDGEINEGSVWEAAMSASKHGLNNLTALVDYNKLQSYGPTSEVQDLEPLADKWMSFGFNVQEVDGHDVGNLREALRASGDPSKPNAVICHTVKGKGIPEAEHNPMWHHKNKLKVAEMAAVEKVLGAI